MAVVKRERTRRESNRARQAGIDVVPGGLDVACGRRSSRGSTLEQVGASLSPCLSALKSGLFLCGLMFPRPR